jgi:hypothetical protein
MITFSTLLVKFSPADRAVTVSLKPTGYARFMVNMFTR